MYARRCKGGDVVVPDVEKPNEDEDVSQQRCRAKTGDVTDQSQGYQHDELNRYQTFGIQNKIRPWSDGIEEGTKVLCNEDHA